MRGKSRPPAAIARLPVHAPAVEPFVRQKNQWVGPCLYTLDSPKNSVDFFQSLVTFFSR